MIKRILPVLAAFTLPYTVWADSADDAISAGVPTAIVQEVTARANERGIAVGELLAPLTDAARRHAAADLVSVKVLEGISKGVPPARIAAVARGFTDRLIAADLVLQKAQSASLVSPTDRKSALLDLSAAVGAGISRAHLDSLVDAAHSSSKGSADSMVSAAHVLGELARQGIPPEDTMNLGVAIARQGPRPASEIPVLFETWRAEGGKDARAFANEAAKRIERGHRLEGMVDAFGDSPNRIVADHGNAKDKSANDGEKHGLDRGLSPGERGDAARAVAPGQITNHGKAHENNKTKENSSNSSSGKSKH